jgi:MFS family permease
MMVSLVQVAVSLPLFLFTLPAGALADVLDSRRLLIAVETAILAVSVIFAGLVSFGLATPTLLLATTFLLGAVGMAAALVIFGVSHEPISAIAACLLAGAAWTVVLTKLYVSAQVALPDWARGRGLAIFLTFIFGATTAGSAIWGKLTEIQGLQHAYFAAAAGLVICVPLSWRWKLQTGAALNLSPALHWRAPTPSRRVRTIKALFLS